MQQYDDSPQGVLGFWRDAGPQRWFTKDPEFDRVFGERWADLHMAAARRELDAWAEDAEGILALLILLDQYPRNTWRGTGHMFATDALALHFARLAVEKGLDQQIPEQLRMFCYLPFEHSESIDDQYTSVRLMQPLGGMWHEYAVVHQRVIEQFGRFPHRNQALGRISSSEELAFLAEGGFSG